MYPIIIRNALIDLHTIYIYMYVYFESCMIKNYTIIYFDDKLTNIK
jgi:hypothetical protein